MSSKMVGGQDQSSSPALLQKKGNNSIQGTEQMKPKHIVPEQYSIQKEYPKHSVSRKNLFLYSNLRNNFQTNQKLGAF